MANIVFFGNEVLATGVTTKAIVLRELIDTGHTIKAVVINQRSVTSRKQTSIAVADVANEHQIPVWSPDKLGEITPQLQACAADIGVLVAFGKIVPKSVIDLFPAGIVNLHPSLLPLGRGPTPIEQAMLSGARKTGVSLMQLSPEMDAGGVYAQAEVNLSQQETKQALTDHLLEIGSAMMIELLPEIVAGQVIAKPQDHSQASYNQRLQKTDGIIDWQKPAIELEREIRALAGWPKSRTTLAGKDVVILKSEIVNISGNPGAIHSANNNELIIYCGKKSLKILELQPAGKTAMTASAFLAGHNLA